MNQRFKECLSEVYLGEQAGEMIFESMLAMAEDDKQRYIFSNMLQLETEGKAIMRPLLVKLGIPIEENKSLRKKVSNLQDQAMDVQEELVTSNSLRPAAIIVKPCSFATAFNSLPT